MFAVIKTGGKQYKVTQNDVLILEKLPGEVGEDIHFDEILLVGGEGGVTVGTPTVVGAQVSAKILDQGRDKKVLIFKKQQRHTYRRKRGHRQSITVVKITNIMAQGATSKAAPAAKATAKAPKKKAAEA